MCGINGLVSNNISSDKLKDSIKSMTYHLDHRGPDSKGFYFDLENYNFLVAFGFARLAIQDLSKFGNQPMESQSRRFVLLFNGEIYNHLELRNLINKNNSIIWKGRSDTETILAAIETFGLDSALNLMDGQFAISLLDKKSKCIYLIRDRFGEKPLYYYHQDGTFGFSSEINTFNCCSFINKAVDFNSLFKFLKYRYIPQPYSIYKNFKKVLPGQILQVNLSNLDINYSYYWSSSDQAISNIQESASLSHDEFLIEIEKKIEDSIKSQLISDVPLGAFLSGGIDSSLVTAILQKHVPAKIKTFTVGFDDERYDESNAAKKVASYLGTDHYEFKLSNSELIKFIKKCPTLYDEPFADSSQIPTYIVSKFAKEHVTVALTGDGGDELFGGYNRYLWAPTLWKYTSSLPVNWRLLLGKSLLNITNLDILDNLSFFVQRPKEKISKIGNALIFSDNLFNFFDSFLSVHGFEDRIFNQEHLKSYKIDNNHFSSFFDNLPPELSFQEKMMLCDINSYLPNDILTKVDRASMSCSLETRAPFLHKDIYNLSWRAPINFKISRDFGGKSPLKHILNKHFPKNFFTNIKKGFAFPINNFMKNDLKEWSEYHLFDIKDEYLDNEFIKLIWDQNLGSKRDFSELLWSIIVFRAWYNKNNFSIES